MVGRETDRQRQTEKEVNRCCKEAGELNEIVSLFQNV